MKNRVKYTKRGFTLIELLTVIAIIGILAGILIPTVGAVRKQANIAATRSQFNNYINAMLQFRSEYGFMPFIGSNQNNAFEFDLSSSGNSETFLQTLTARDADGSLVTPPVGGNRRQISFMSISDNELLNPESSTRQIVDRFLNPNITVFINGDGSGVMRNMPKDGATNTTVRSPIAIRSNPGTGSSRNPDWVEVTTY